MSDRQITPMSREVGIFYRSRKSLIVNYRRKAQKRMVDFLGVDNIDQKCNNLRCTTQWESPRVDPENTYDAEKVHFQINDK